MGPLQRNLPVEQGAALICHAAAHGVDFVDTAEYYHTYPYIRAAMPDVSEADGLYQILRL